MRSTTMTVCDECASAATSKPDSARRAGPQLGGQRNYIYVVCRDVLLDVWAAIGEIGHMYVSVPRKGSGASSSIESMPSERSLSSRAVYIISLVS